MENLGERLQGLEARTRKMEAQLRRWRLAACLIGLTAVGLAVVVRSDAQQPVEQAYVVSALFTVKGSTGNTIFTVMEYEDGQRKSKDAMLTLYRNGLPAALVRTTGMTYRDAADPKENFLNVLETWLYKYPDKGSPVPYLVSSTGLTRSGGSFVIFNDQAGASTTPPFAARLTAKEGIGGQLSLFNTEGKVSKIIDAK